MIIRVYSDIHNEFHSEKPFTITALPTDAETVLVLAGDIDYLRRGVKYANSMADRFKAIIYVPGNHEFYNNKHGKLGYEMRCETEPNVYVLNNKMVTIDDTVFVGSTFWTDIPNSPIVTNSITLNMNDFKYIRYDERYNYRKFTLRDWMTEHKKSIDFVSNAIYNAPKGKKLVVVTHHAPSWKSNLHYDYTGGTDHAYYSSYDPLVAETDLWVHGHTHESVDYIIPCEGSRTGRVVANCRGYYELIGGDTLVPSGSQDKEFDLYGVGIKL